MSILQVEEDPLAVEVDQLKHIGNFNYTRLADFGAAISGANKLLCQEVLEELDECTCTWCLGCCLIGVRWNCRWSCLWSNARHPIAAAGLNYRWVILWSNARHQIALKCRAIIDF